MRVAFKTVLFILSGLLLAGMLYYFTSTTSPRLLRGSILDGAEPGDINAIEFVTPRGTTMPINNMVTISTVFVDFTAAAELDGFTDGNLSGSEIISSFIVFDNAGGLPAGVYVDENRIIVPDGTPEFDLYIYLPGGGASVSTQPLTITEPPTCENLEAHIMRADGEGIYVGTDTLPTSSESDIFDFGSNAYESINLSYPAPPDELGRQSFDIIITFVPDISDDSVNGISERALITSSTADGFYEISVKMEPDSAITASNFAYAFNNLLALNSPFYPYIEGTDNDQIVLRTKELGEHTLSYNCSYVVGGSSASCNFTGGADGDVDLLMAPLAIDNTITQGTTSLVYAAGSIGVNDWVSSDPDILEVSSLTEADESEGVTSIEFIFQPLTGTADYDPMDGSYSVYDCEETYDEDVPDLLLTQICAVDVNIPVTYAAPAGSYTSIVTIGTEEIDVPMEISKLTGSLSGTSSWVYGVGMSMSLTGEVTGTAEGYASGTAEGMVYGTVTADITTNITIDDDVSEASIAVIRNAIPVMGDPDELVITSGLLEEVSGTFGSTVKLVSNQVTDFAYLHAKKPGNAILTVIDDQNCTASLEIEVSALRAILRMSGRDHTEPFYTGDTAQINAYLGNADGEIDETQNITASSLIEWHSSNPGVATVDATGLLTAVGPGTTNITVTYNTGDSIIGTIESDPLQITVSKVTGLTIALDEETQAALPPLALQKATETVFLAVHSSDAAGHSITLEGNTIDIELPAGTYENELERIDAIVNTGGTSLFSQIDADPLIEVNSVPNFPGVLVLRAVNQVDDGDGIIDIDENGMVDITTTASSQNLSVIPNSSGNIDLPASEIYELMVIAEYDNGITKRLPATQVTWVNTPIHYLEQASLEAGLLRPIYIGGTSTVTAQFVNADGSVVTSNSLTVTAEDAVKMAIIEMEDRSPADSFEVGDSAQINAYYAYLTDTLDETNSITTSAGIEWISTNEDVATIDATGLLTAVGPGRANIYVRYDTGEAEIGTVESAPIQISVTKIAGLIVALDEGSQKLLSVEEMEKAHESVLFAIHSPEAAGRSVVIEGQVVDITLPAGVYANDVERVQAISTELETNFEALTNDAPTPQQIVQVTPMEGSPGILILKPVNQTENADGDEVADLDENGIIDIRTTASAENVSIIPGFGRGIDLPASVTYGLMVIAQYDNTLTKRLPATDVTWINTPAGYLEQASLDTGLLKPGDYRGTSTVIAEFQNADGSVVSSNELAVTVESGPVIEYARRIGSGTIVKGGQVNLEVRVSDVDTIADIKDISVSLVKSDYSTYSEINADGDAIWFTATSYPDQIETTDEGEDETEAPDGDTQVLQYKVYSLPVSIPVDQNLFDGNYKLILSISDALNHTINYVYPIYIGEQASGDVNGDGKVNMIDVILAFRIAVGAMTATQPQLEAANIDKTGNVTMVDVILLFRKITSS